jgi:hypothetical protein
LENSQTMKYSQASFQNFIKSELERTSPITNGINFGI